MPPPRAHRTPRRLARGLLPLAVLLGACGPRPGPTAPAPVETGWHDVPGGRLYYEVAGAGPAVVLLHGGFGDRRMWDGPFAALARDFRVVRYDHRGFGRSTRPEAAYSPVADLLGLLDRLGIARAHLVGNSMGGALALDVALLHPERVGRVVVAASGANGYPYADEDVESVRAVFRTARAEGAERAVPLWLAHPMVAVAARDSAVAPRLRRMVWENRAMFTMGHWPAEPVAPPTFERLGEIRAPVLFVVGEHDTPLVRRVAGETAARVAGARLAVMEGTDHLPQMERPDAFNRLVVGFLSGR